MKDEQFEDDYPMIVTPSRWDSPSAWSDVTVTPRNSQPVMGLIRMPDMSQLLRSVPRNEVR